MFCKRCCNYVEISWSQTENMKTVYIYPYSPQWLLESFTHCLKHLLQTTGLSPHSIQRTLRLSYIGLLGYFPHFTADVSEKKAQNSSQSFPILLQFDWGHILWLCSLTFIYLFCDSTLILLWKIYLSPVSTIVGGLSVNVPCFPLNKWWEYAESNIPLEWEFWESYKEGKWLECRFCEIVYISFCLS